MKNVFPTVFKASTGYTRLDPSRTRINDFGSHRILSVHSIEEQRMKAVSKFMFVLVVVLLAVLLTTVGVGAQEATQAATQEASPISEAAAMQFAEKFNSIFDGPNLAVADEILAPDFVGHLPLAPTLDLAGWKGYVSSFYAAMPDLTETVNQVIVSKDRVVLHVTYTGTQNGPLFGIPATGKHVTLDGIGIFRFNEKGQAVENWAIIDVVGLLAQIGAFPPTQPAAS